MKLSRVVLGAMGVAIAGCSGVVSEDLATARLYAELLAEETGGGQVKTKATLSVGPGSLTFLQLSAGDLLTATVGPTARAMTPRSALGVIWYEADFEGAPAGGAVKISLLRQRDSSAPESVATLPQGFEFSGPTANTTVPRTGGMTASWSNPGKDDPMRISARGSCIQPVDAALASDTGSHRFDPFLPTSGNESLTCDLLITLVRTGEGTVDPAYGKGGVFTATASRTLTLSSTP